MKKYRYKQKMTSLLLALLLLAESFMPVMKAEAAGNPRFEKNLMAVYEPKSTYGNTEYWRIQNFPKNGKIKNLKSSNTKVLKVSWDKKNSDKYMRESIKMQYKKAGKATITFDLVYGKKTRHFKSKIVIKKYQSPCKSFKLGKKEYASKFKEKSQHYLTYKGTKKYKVSIKAKSGWKLEGIYFYDIRTGKRKKIKNNSTVTCKSRWHYVQAEFCDKKTYERGYVIMYLQK